MIISSQEVLRLREVRMLTAEIGKVFRTLVSEQEELEKRLIEQAKAGAKVQAICPFRLRIATEPKPYRPPYKTCAIELSGEKKVTEWVTNNDPHDTKDVLSLVPKQVEQPRVSKVITAAIESVKATTAQPA